MLIEEVIVPLFAHPQMKKMGSTEMTIGIIRGQVVKKSAIKKVEKLWKEI